MAAALALAAGLAGSVQAAVMGRFGERIGALEAVAWAFCLSAVLAVAVLLVARRGVGGIGDAWTTPKWLWLGAVLGAFIVFTITVASPRIGTTATIALLVAGQLAAGAVGLLGLQDLAQLLQERDHPVLRAGDAESIGYRPPIPVVVAI